MASESAAGPLTADREEQLVGAMRAGEEAAFQTFSERYIPGLYRFARRRLHGDRELTKDVVQATVCKAIEKLDTYRGEAPLSMWLRACCRNEIAAHFRRALRRPREVELPEWGEGDVAGGGLAGTLREDPEDQLLRLEAAELVHAALDLLPPAYARAVEWRYLEGLGVNEIAERLDSSYKATESLLSRAREAFRSVYERLAREQGNAVERIERIRAEART